MQSYLASEFRALGDVELVEKGAKFGMDVLLADSIVNGFKDGFAVSSTFTESVICGDFRHDDFKGGSIYMISRESLRSTAANIVAKFDVKILEPHRKLLKTTQK